MKPVLHLNLVKTRLMVVVVQDERQPETICIADECAPGQSSLPLTAGLWQEGEVREVPAAGIPALHQEESRGASNRGTR